MQFSPYLLLRHPTYNLTHLDVFSILPDEFHTLEKAVEERRKHFLKFITSRDLLLSLPFSSRMVYQAIPHYEFHAAVKIRKKERQTERALMKYLARMSLNPSPLAAFAKSQFVDWQWNRLNPHTTYALSLSLTQRKEFFDLCYCDSGLQKYMKYRLNPSLRRTTNDFIYLHKNEAEESKVEIESDPEFEAMFLALKGKEFTFAQFAQLTNYAVNDFLEAQLIVPSYPIYAAQEFITVLIEEINSRHNLSFKLEDIVGICSDKMSDKDAIIQQKHWDTQIKAYANSLEVALDHKLYAERMYYLNTYSQEQFSQPSFDRKLLSREVLEVLQLADSAISREETSSLQWDTMYEASAPLRHNFDLSKIVIEQKSEGEIQLSIPSIKELKKYQSFGIMLSFSNQERPRLINVSTPYGKFFSPALELASDEVMNKLKQWIQNTAKNVVSLKDDSLHNKNKANEFVAELNSFGLDYQTPIEDRVFLDIHENGDIVNQDTKEPASLVNLGIEDFSNRSSLYQNLFKHSDQLPNIPELVSAIQNKYRIIINEAVSFVPRLSTKHLILGSQKWKATKEAFELFQNPKDIPLEQLNRWREQIGIPRIVECSVDEGRSFFIDFYNPWLVDSFLKLIRKMDSTCTFSELGIGDEHNKHRIFEAYFEVSI